jgi:hypothetical protein
VFVTLSEGTFLLDTGSPTSFGETSPLVLGARVFALPLSYNGLIVDELSKHVGRHADGLLGTDVLNEFDVLIDLPQSLVCLSTEELDCEGDRLPLAFIPTLPTLTAVVDGTPMTVFFDTGAQLSYLQAEFLSRYMAEGTADDFYPGRKPFRTDTFRIPSQLGRTLQNLGCGRLPPDLEEKLIRGDANGILGNEFLVGRRVGYFPRRRVLVLNELSD